MVPQKLVLVKLDDPLYGNSHAVSVLSICDIKCRSAAFYPAREESDLYPVGCNKKGCFPNTADERIDRFELLVGDCKYPKSNGIFRLRPWTLDGYAGLANAQGLT